ncbi:V-type ATP synthase subunit F [Stygiolobus azoricus]|uniref:V-type ATP synthase subunit F n=1 Tax=Stygiolobus azoricus TaxID=41675 RepID=A0A650CNJ0_9CREN|nr:V-type ATP synthase subunit F [Stygiolobus azoricus]QGR19421.1 V-type ATP synthase subunit F [Stygiolobus azoricus]
MGKVVVLGDRYTVNLFRMIGTEGLVLDDPLNLEDTLVKLKKREDIDLILVANDLYNPVKEKIESLVIDQKKPLITIIPTPFSQGQPLDVKGLILKALGFG